jgi:hypothetical protein
MEFNENVREEKNEKFPKGIKPYTLKLQNALFKIVK